MNAVATKPADAATAASGPYHTQVLEVKHWTDRLFSFRTTRPAEFRFRSGEFAMIGLPTSGGKPLLRAYSMASPAWDEELEFFSIKVENGPLTSRLQKIKSGDTVLIGRKSTGTLVVDALTPAKRLWMFSTGTGFAPFASVIRDPQSYDKFEELIVTHCCRDVAELGYSQKTVQDTLNHEFLGELVQGRLRYYDTVTREDYPRKGRLTDLMQSGDLFSALDVPKINPATDRVMICGSTDMLRDTKALMESFGLTEGANNAPAEFVIERAFVG